MKKKELKEGLKEERGEHSKTVGGSERKIREMVEAHLKKDPNYYSKLKKAGL